MIKAVIFDMDGTLLAICKRSVAQALRQTIERRRQDEFVSARARRLLNYVVDTR